ncbi:Mad3/BUB1 homology region 1-domain-containing protein [Umbelopsis sp. AD052]|nr:Mad3/BUB1 homology region 1-domain-containing protein [Umbelopsis sp. AD052]
MPEDRNYAMSETERRALLDSIPEFSAFESHKENITQKRHGRKATDLAHLFAMNDHDRIKHLDEQRKVFHTAVEHLDELDDPLEPYLVYIDFVEACHTQGPNSELVEVLQEATRRFEHDDMYQHDIRYLICWTKFARLAEDWQTIFKYLADHRIGLTHARYYEEYAQVQEEHKRYDDALATYRQGIAKNARPVARLKRHFEDARVRIQQKREGDSGQPPSRSVLGEKAGSALGNAGIRPPSLHDVLDMSAPRAKFSVFVQSDESSGSSSISSPAASQKLASDVYRRKENVLEKSVFKGSIIPQKPTPKPSPAKFAVFRDDMGTDNDTSQSPQTKGPSSSHHDTALNNHANGSSFAYYMGSRSISSSIPNSSDRFMEWFSSVKSTIIRSEDSRGKPEWVAAMRSNDNENGSEMSFEEMRTLHPKYRLNMAPTTSFDTDFEEKLVTPDSPTIETKAAMKIVGELWTTAVPDFDEDSMDLDDRPRRPVLNTISDENGDARLPLGEVRTPTRRPLSIVDHRSPLDERLFGSPSKRRHIDPKP